MNRTDEPNCRVTFCRQRKIKSKNRAANRSALAPSAHLPQSPPPQHCLLPIQSLPSPCCCVLRLLYPLPQRPNSFRLLLPPQPHSLPSSPGALCMQLLQPHASPNSPDPDPDPDPDPTQTLNFPQTQTQTQNPDSNPDPDSLHTIGVIHPTARLLLPISELYRGVEILCLRQW